MGPKSACALEPRRALLLREPVLQQQYATRADSSARDLQCCSPERQFQEQALRVRNNDIYVDQEVQGEEGAQVLLRCTEHGRVGGMDNLSRLRQGQGAVRRLRHTFWQDPLSIIANRGRPGRLLGGWGWRHFFQAK